MFRYLPEQASKHAADVDWIHNLITDLSVLFTVLIVGAMLYFAWKYRKRNGVDHETPQIEGSHTLEIIWTVVPTIICIIIAYYGIIYYHDIRKVDPNAMTINVTGQKWFWEFEYENGKKTTSEFVIPVDEPVRLLMQSKDVMHSFFIPSMRVKRDVIPGSYTYLTFTPIKTGKYQAYCTEYCGDSHYAMLANLKVVSRAEFDAWVEDKGKIITDPAKRGALVYKAKGCNTCHSLDGSRIIGPTFSKLFGSEREFADGTKAVADEVYLRNSIYNPNSQIVKTYSPGLMPVFEGQIKEEEMLDVIAYIKTLDGSQPVVEVEEEEVVVDPASMTPEQRGELLYKNNACIGCHSLDGSKVVGPSFQGLYGRQGEFEAGGTYTADEAYIKESILESNKNIVKGYAPAMPAYQFKDEEIADITAYIKSIK